MIKLVRVSRSTLSKHPLVIPGRHRVSTQEPTFCSLLSSRVEIERLYTSVETTLSNERQCAQQVLMLINDKVIDKVNWVKNMPD